MRTLDASRIRLALAAAATFQFGFYEMYFSLVGGSRLMLYSTQRISRLRLGTLATAKLFQDDLKLMLAALAAALVSQLELAVVAQDSSPRSGSARTIHPIPWFEIGARAVAQYSGDGLAMFATERGAVRLRCAFQRLEGEVTTQGL